MDVVVSYGLSNCVTAVKNFLHGPRVAWLGVSSVHSLAQMSTGSWPLLVAVTQSSACTDQTVPVAPAVPTYSSDWPTQS